jgi:hypothetical protein
MSSARECARSAGEHTGSARERASSAVLSMYELSCTSVQAQLDVGGGQLHAN